MHAELVGGLALIAAVTRQDFRDETFLEFAHGISVRNAGGVHLVDEAF